MHVNPGYRSKEFDIEAMGVFNGATLSLRIGRRENTQSTASYTSAVSPSSSTGMFRLTAGGRIHEFELTVAQSSGTLWTHAQGLDVTGSLAGKK